MKTTTSAPRSAPGVGQTPARTDENVCQERTTTDCTLLKRVAKNKQGGELDAPFDRLSLLPSWAEQENNTGGKVSEILHGTSGATRCGCV